MAALGHFLKLKRDLGLAFGAHFLHVFPIKMFLVILYQYTKFKCHTFFPSQDIKQRYVIFLSTLQSEQSTTLAMAYVLWLIAYQNKFCIGEILRKNITGIWNNIQHRGMKFCNRIINKKGGFSRSAKISKKQTRQVHEIIFKDSHTST